MQNTDFQEWEIENGLQNFRCLYCVRRLRRGMPGWSDFRRRYLRHRRINLHRLWKLRKCLPGWRSGPSRISVSNEGQRKARQKSLMGFSFSPVFRSFFGKTYQLWKVSLFGPILAIIQPYEKADPAGEEFPRTIVSALFYGWFLYSLLSYEFLREEVIFFNIGCGQCG